MEVGCESVRLVISNENKSKAETPSLSHIKVINFLNRFLF